MRVSGRIARKYTLRNFLFNQTPINGLNNNEQKQRPIVAMCQIEEGLVAALEETPPYS